MKTLVIFSGPKVYGDTLFFLIDPETGELLASHLCSSSNFAKMDLHDGRRERLENWKKKYNDKTEAKFLYETNYRLDEVCEKVNQYKNKKGTKI